MHEFALIQNLLEIIQQEIKTHKPPQSTIRDLTLTVGALELHSKESFRQACVIGTVAAKPPELVILKSAIGVQRVIQMLAGE
ncbi:hypothetical protein ACFL02_10335 [Planctomycetota bacterium]